jgi:integrase
MTDSRAKGSDGSKKEFWRNTLKRWEESKKSQAQFCREERLNPNTFSFWKKTIQGLAADGPDYFLFLSLTGLRRNEAATLRWTDVDLEARTITIRAEISKNKREHWLPLTDFLIVLLKQRQRCRWDSEYVFPSRIKRLSHIADSKHALRIVVRRSGCLFVLHDLRRGFISQAARLGIPHHIIKKLANHIAARDVTDGYVIIHPEHLREPMALINNRFLTLFGCNISDWWPDESAAG